MQEDKAFKNWEEYYVSSDKSAGQLMWPCESAIHMMMSYLPEGGYDGTSVLDVGFGNGNNFPFYLSNNVKVSGVEVTKDICDLVTKKFTELHQQVDLQVGKNNAIPFEDNSFDLLISWNAIHYVNNEEEMISAIKEFARVLKQGGRFILSTTGPEHVILQGSKTVGDHLYLLQREGDFRLGEVFFCLETEGEVRRYFEPEFENIFVGRELKNLPANTVDYFLISGVKR